MAYLRVTADVSQMGDNNSDTTSYVVSLVSCSNTDTPLLINGYPFKTTVSGAAKTGSITAVFNGVPPNTVLPAYKVKVTGTTNGRSISILGDCNSNGEIICAEDITTCSISSVSLGQVICKDSGVSIPYTFKTDTIGAHKIELFKVGSGTSSTSVKATSVQVTNIGILQTGVINLSDLDSDNYKLFVSKVDDSGTSQCNGSSNTTLLTCSTNNDNCAKPTFDVVTNTPSCNAGLQNTDGSIAIANVINGTKVSYCLGQTWTCVEDYNSAKDITTSSSFTVFDNKKVDETKDQDYYVIRVYNGASCYQDKTVALTKPICNADLCNIDTFYNGINADKKFYYKNAGTGNQTLYVRFVPATPMKFTLSLNDNVKYATLCGGVSNSGCITCTQQGVVCGKIVVKPNDTVTIDIDSTCDGTTTSLWFLKTSCSPLTECTSSVVFGATNVCGIVQPVNSIAWTCNADTNDVTAKVEGTYGGISNEYQYGFDANNVWKQPSQVDWSYTNLANFPKGKQVTVWIRDKNNTDCYTTISATTPSCIGTTTNPILKQSSLLEILSQAGNKITSDASNIDTTHKYESIYKYDGDPTAYLGYLNKTTKSVSFPTLDKGGRISGYITDKGTGQVSNKVFFNVINKETISLNTVENKLQDNDSATYLHLGVTQTGNATNYKVLVNDAVSGAKVADVTFNASNDLFIKHNETNRPVTVQIVDADNLLQGSQQKSITLNQLTPPGNTTNCDCVAKVAYGVVARNSGNQSDSISIMAKVSGCKRYKIYLEDINNRGTYNLYNDTTSGDQSVNNLAGNYSDYNLLISGGTSDRIWRNNGYGVKIDFYSGTTLTKSVNFVVDLDGNTAIGSPINKFDCTAGAANNCSLVDKAEIGYQSATSRVQSRLLNNQWYPVTQLTTDVTKDRFYPRAANFLDNTNVTISQQGVTKSCFVASTSDYGGLTAPLVFKESTGANAVAGGGNFVPTGYQRGYTGDGAMYFELKGSTMVYPCDQACNTYTSALPTPDGNTPTFLIREKINFNITPGTVGYVSTFASRAEALSLASLVTTDANAGTANQKKDGANQGSNFDTCYSVRNGVYQSTLVVGDYFINNNLSNTFGPTQCGFLVVQNKKSDGTYYTLDQQYTLITCNPCGQIIAVEVINLQTTVVPSSMAALAGPQRTIAGQLNTATSYQPNPTVMNFGVTSLGNNQVRITNNGVNKNPNDGRVIKYVLESHMGPNYLTLTDADLANLSLNGLYPVLLHGWFMNPGDNYGQGGTQNNYQGYVKLNFQ